MELSDLKQQWKNDLGEIKIPEAFSQLLSNTRIDKQARTLKSLFILRLVSIPLACAYLAIAVKWQHTIYTMLLVCFLIPTSIISMVYFYKNYRLLQLLQQMETPVKTTLENHIKTIETIMRRTAVLTNTVFWLFIVLAEVIVYYSNNPDDIPHWFHQTIAVRIAAYAALFCCMYFYNKYGANYKYKRYIKHLRKVLQQTI